MDPCGNVIRPDGDLRYALQDPPAFTLPSERDIQRIVETYYGLPSVAQCEFHQTGKNSVYRVSLSNEAIVFARLECIRRPTKEIDLEFVFLSAMDVLDVSLGTPIPTKGGHWWMHVNLPEGPRRFTIFKAVEGAEPIDDLASFYASGMALGKMHAQSIRAGLPSLSRDETPEGILRRAYEVILQSNVPDSAQRQAFLTLKDRLEGRFIETLADRCDWRWGMCHGDPAYNRAEKRDGNGDRDIGFFDFDDVAMGYFAWDLAHFFEKLFHSRPFEDGGAIDRTAAESWMRFLAGYETSVSISEAELLAVPAFAALRSLNRAEILIGNKSIYGRSFCLLEAAGAAQGALRYMRIVCSHEGVSAQA